MAAASFLAAVAASNAAFSLAREMAFA